MAEKIRRERKPRYPHKAFEEISRKYGEGTLSSRNAVHRTFNFENENKQREFFRNVFYRIFDFDPAAQKCVPTVVDDDGKCELIVQDVGVSGIDGRRVAGTIRGRPLTSEEALSCMGKSVYYDSHYYYVIHDPMHLSYITDDNLSRLAYTLDPVRNEIPYLHYIRPSQAQPLYKDILDLKASWIDQGYTCIAVEPEAIIPVPVRSQSWQYLEDEDTYRITCTCGEVFTADLQESIVSLGDGNACHEYRAACPACGKIIGEKIYRKLCRYCGKPFEVPGQEAGRYRDFCDDVCKQKYQRFERRFQKQFSGTGSQDADLEKIEILYRSGFYPIDIERRYMSSRCRYCGSELSPDKRTGSEFCDEACKKAFKYKFKKWRMLFPDATSDDFTKILQNGRHHMHTIWLRLMRLKWWIVGGAPMEGPYIEGWRDLLGDEFDRVVDWIRWEREKERSDPHVREENIRRLRKLLEKGDLDIYPATEAFYLQGYFGDEFANLIHAISQEIEEQKKEILDLLPQSEEECCRTESCDDTGKRCR